MGSGTTLTANLIQYSWQLHCGPTSPAYCKSSLEVEEDLRCNGLDRFHPTTFTAIYYPLRCLDLLITGASNMWAILPTTIAIGHWNRFYCRALQSTAIHCNPQSTAIHCNPL